MGLADRNDSIYYIQWHQTNLKRGLQKIVLDYKKRQMGSGVEKVQSFKLVGQVVFASAISIVIYGKNLGEPGSGPTHETCGC